MKFVGHVTTNGKHARCTQHLVKRACVRMYVPVYDTDPDASVLLCAICCQPLTHDTDYDIVFDYTLKEIYHG
jgi:hypothetical protein